MPESTESKQSKPIRKAVRKPRTPKRIIFAPQTMGYFVLLIIVLAFIVGAVRRELALTLTGAVFLTLWIYCLTMTLLLAFIHRKYARHISMRPSPREIACGGGADLIFAYNGTGKPPRFRLPGILIRCRLLLSTKDDRHIKHDFDPATELEAKATHTKIEANERGAFFSEYDELAIFDSLGFFRFAFCIPQEADPRLIVCPHPADDPPSPTVRSGGTAQRTEFQLKRSDSLTDHRPYIPGDDPRRINWKLYSHGGELFVREGEPEPPPHSNILILIDSHYDTLLYSAEKGRRGIDLLCENALAAALACAGSGMDVLVSYTGAGGSASKENYLRGNNPAEMAAIMAQPAAISYPAKRSLSRKLSHGAETQMAQLPLPNDSRGVLVFALPRASAEASALDNFLNRYANTDNSGRPVEIAFLYESSEKDTELDDAAETCVSFFNRKQYVRAQRFKVN